MRNSAEPSTETDPLGYRVAILRVPADFAARMTRAGDSTKTHRTHPPGWAHAALRKIFMALFTSADAGGGVGANVGATTT